MSSRRWDISRDYGSRPRAPSTLERISRLAATAGAVIGVWWLATLIIDRPLTGPGASVDLPPVGDSWPAGNGDLGATRRTPAKPALGPDPVWSITLGAPIDVAPIADDRHLYVGVAGQLLAVSVTDGSISWRYDDTLTSAPLTAGGMVFYAKRPGILVAIDAASGTLRWQTDVAAPLLHAPALAGGTLIVYSDAGMFGLEARTGRRLWSVDVDVVNPRATPLVLGDRIAVATAEDVRLYDRSTGHQEYRVPFFLPTGLAASGERVFAVSTRTVAAIDARSRQPWWETTRPLWTWLHLGGAAPPPPRLTLWAVALPREARAIHAPALNGDVLAVADDEGTVRLFDASTGDLRWAIEAGRQSGAPVLTPDGLLLSGEEALSLRDLADGAEVARVTLARADRRYVLVTRHGTYVADPSGTVTAFRAAAQSR